MFESTDRMVNNQQSNRHKIGRWPRDHVLPAVARPRAGAVNPIAIVGIVLGIALLAAGIFEVSGQNTATHSHDGAVINCTSSMLTMIDANGMRSSHEVTPSTKVTRDGVACQAADLNSGTRIRVTTAIPLRGPALAIDAFERYAEAEK
jgi:hypothetical protein